MFGMLFQQTFTNKMAATATFLVFISCIYTLDTVDVFIFPGIYFRGRPTPNQFAGINIR